MTKYINIMSNNCTSFHNYTQCRQNTLSACALSGSTASFTMVHDNLDVHGQYWHIESLSVWLLPFYGSL